MKKRKIIIDCSPGVDDAIALAYAASKRDALEVLAVTTAAGKQSAEAAAGNALDLTAFFGLDAPVSQGMAEPMARKASAAETEYAKRFHGENGLGGITLPRSSRKATEEQAVFYLKKILTALSEGEQAALVCTGALTNIAFLLKLFPGVKEKIQEILIAGGAAGTGNITACAEFNMYTDPEAARVVFDAGIPLIFCGLNAAEKCTLTRRQILKLCQSPSPVAAACGDMAGYSLENTSDKYRGMTNMGSVVPLMYLVNPEIFSRRRTLPAVDCSDGQGRGTVNFDFRWWEREEEELRDLVLIDAEGSRFQEELILALYELGEQKE